MSIISEFKRKIEKLETVVVNYEKERTLDELLFELTLNERNTYTTIEELENQMDELVRKWNKLKKTNFKSPKITDLDYNKDIVSINSIYNYIKQNYVLDSNTEIDKKDRIVNINPDIQLDPNHNEQEELMLLDNRRDLLNPKFELLEAKDPTTSPFSYLFELDPRIIKIDLEDIDLNNPVRSILVTVYQIDEDSNYLIGFYSTHEKDGDLVIRSYTSIINGKVDLKDKDQVKEICLSLGKDLNTKIESINDKFREYIKNDKNGLDYDTLLNNLVHDTIIDLYKNDGINFIRDTHNSSIYKVEKDRYETKVDGFSINEGVIVR